MDEQKPRFACKIYPKCPDRIETVSEVTEVADEEEGFGPTTSTYGVDVTGPCEKRCHEEEMDAPINHRVISIIGGRVVDIGG